MSGLLMKYFVLKPDGNDVYASASRDAMRAYATHICYVNPELRKELMEWVHRAEDAVKEPTELPHKQAKELRKIHEICMCIGECKPVEGDDSLTVRVVKAMAQALNKETASLDALALAIANAGYEWTPEMRKAYDEAFR